MSVRVSEAVWRYSKQKGAAFAVLLAIAESANPDGSAFRPLSVAELAERARIKPRTVQIALRKLERAKEIRTEESTGRGHANRYHVTLPLIKGEKESLNHLHPLPERAKSVQERAKSTTQKGESDSPPIDNPVIPVIPSEAAAMEQRTESSDSASDAASPPLPPGFVELDGKLRVSPGYQPTPDFIRSAARHVQRIEQRHPEVDWTEQAVKLLDYCRHRHGGTCRVGTVLNFLNGLWKDVQKLPVASAPTKLDVPEPPTLSPEQIAASDAARAQAREQLKQIGMGGRRNGHTLDEPVDLERKRQEALERLTAKYGPVARLASGGT